MGNLQANEIELKKQTYKQMDYKASLFDIIAAEIEIQDDNYAGFYGFVLGVVTAYESWERDIYETD